MIFAPGDVIDAKEFLLHYGALGLLGLLLVGLLLWAARAYVLRLLSDYSDERKQDREETTEILRIVQQIEVRSQKAEQAIDLLESMEAAQAHVASEEHWLHCPIERCPHMMRLSTECGQTKAEMIKFVAEARESRVETQALLKEIRVGLELKIEKIYGVITAFVNDVGKELLHAIRNGSGKR